MTVVRVTKVVVVVGAGSVLSTCTLDATVVVPIVSPVAGAGVVLDEVDPSRLVAILVSLEWTPYLTKAVAMAPRTIIARLPRLQGLRLGRLVS